MAQPGQTTIQLYSTTTAATTPSPSNLVSGELALNLTDKKIFSKDGSGTVVEMSMSPLNPSYTGTLTGGTGVVNLGAGQVYKAADGKVGFGNTSPGATLDVNGEVRSRTVDGFVINNGTKLGSISYAGGLLIDRVAGSSLLFAQTGDVQGRFDSAGNFGLGVTPSAWSSTDGGAFQFGGGRSALYSYSNAATLASNAYYNGVNRYVASGVGASLYQQLGGAHYWIRSTDASPVAGGVIATSTAMTLDASGNLGLGVTPSAWGGSSKGIELAGDGVLESRGAIGFAFGANYYNNGSSDVNKAGGWAGKMEVGSGYIWKGATGVAGNATTLATMMTLDTIGNLGLGVTPSAWHALIKALSVGRAGSSLYSFTGSNIVGLTCNASYGASGWKYETTDAATRYQQDAGVHTWYTAPSGTGGANIGAAFVNTMTLDASGNLTPGGDNTQTNGSGAKRWSVIYAGTGTINTSDAREKTAVRVMAADEIEAAKALSKEIGVYQFLASVEAKGDKARHHIGMTVQRAIEIMKHHGLDPFSYGFICYDKWDEETREHPAIEARDAVEAKNAVLDDEGNVIEPAVEAQPAIKAKDAWTEVTQQAGDRYSFRYDQLTLFIARGIDARLVALESA